jgi:putative tricarboxylic transport membrane protein
VSDQTEDSGHSRFELTVPTKPAVIAATIVILAWLVFMAYETTNMLPPILRGYPGDAFFPRLVLIFALICACAILIKAKLTPRGAQLAAGEQPTFALHWLEFATVCALVAAYGLLLEPVGFEITTLILMLALLGPRMASGGEYPGRSFGRALALSLATTLVAYVGFGLLLRVPLPLLFLPRYIQY